MAARSWATSIFTAIGVAAGAGAAQLGLGYGLGIISWQPTGNSATVWVSSLAWVAWLAASSTVIGALCADRLSPADTPVLGDASTPAEHALTAAWRIVIALSAAVGALIIVPLVAVPSRTPRPDNVAPYFTAGGYAIAGIIVGLLIAVGALAARAIAANVIASSAWLWILAVVAVIDVVRADGNLATAAQLGTWQFTDATWIRGMVNLPGALLMLAIALVIGALAAWPASRRGDNRVGVAVSGAAGPLLVALAYFLAAPAVGEQNQQLSAFVIAPYAVLAGLAGSVIVSAIGPRGSRAQARADRKAAAADRDARAASDIADWTQALADADAAEARRRTETGEQPDGDDPWAAAPDRSAEPVTIGAGSKSPAATGNKAATTSKSTSKTAAPAGKASVTAAKANVSTKSADLDSAKDLESDAYAPARAYGGTESSGRTYTSESANRAYAEDTVTDDDPEPAKPAAARGSVEPLWPSDTGTGAPTEPKPAPGRGRGRGRGRSGE
ncbi:hypothetical protein ACFO1B_27355 [Dactylosporangium siamense]|uniref:Uncharacterized protein n=1 Tax=Dactylosporangium siamense TaxID=685454 RepID=A0A919PQT9_9ACTN|nr:hypothetical protein [Dactylosporangium siamense]GIG47646.1 hypothetical protein Dsi01nite_056870 [Dactylosporangium siamense]